jgi:hypothetical protein
MDLKKPGREKENFVGRRLSKNLIAIDSKNIVDASRVNE